MKPKLQFQLTLAFALKELIATIAIGALLVCVVVVELAEARDRAHRICCNCNLKQIGLGFRTWALDHHDIYPMGLSTNSGGTREYLTMGRTYLHFQLLSNELATPLVLICPRDTRCPATNFLTGFTNINLSYFVGFVASDESPQALLSGDRSLTNGTAVRNQVLELPSAVPAGWTRELHRDMGNVALADGSVQQLSTPGLRQALKDSGGPLSRLAMP
jgi:hypothetical protein